VLYRHFLGRLETDLEMKPRDRKWTQRDVMERGGRKWEERKEEGLKERKGREGHRDTEKDTSALPFPGSSPAYPSPGVYSTPTLPLS